MATSLDKAFEEFLQQLRATTTETQAAASHRSSIEAKLKQAFGLTSFFRSGSFGNGTNIANYSDVDYFAVIPPKNLKRNSSLSLSAVADALRERFPQTANIRVDAPGVRVPFGLDGAEACEIVPVDETGRTSLGFRQFDIPDGAGGWKFSAPESHNAYVSNIDKRHGGMVKPLIRFVKAWKFMRNAPIKSFYIEIRTAHYADGETLIDYGIDIARIFHLMLEDGLADYPDPRFPNDGFLLSACNTENQKLDALSKLERAARWASEAFDHRQAGRPRSAFASWDLVFNGEFPPWTPS